MKTKDLHFYFDFLSPYAYFAWVQLERFCANHQLNTVLHPVVFGKLLDHWGQLGPAEIPPKKEFIFKYCYRYAALNNLSFDPPKYHPFNPLHALRLSLEEACGENQRQVISAIFKAGWSHGRDLGEPTELISILSSVDLDGEALVEKTKQTSIKERLKEETRQAIAKGVFGIPTIIIDDQLFWGNDQFEHIALYLDGKDPLDKNALAAVLARPRAIERKRMEKLM